VLPPIAPPMTINKPVNAAKSNVVLTVFHICPIVLPPYWFNLFVEKPEKHKSRHPSLDKRRNVGLLDNPYPLLILASCQFPYSHTLIDRLRLIPQGRFAESARAVIYLPISIQENKCLVKPLLYKFCIRVYLAFALSNVRYTQYSDHRKQKGGVPNIV
jgi:hypothetical protein